WAEVRGRAHENCSWAPQIWCLCDPSTSKEANAFFTWCHTIDSTFGGHGSLWTPSVVGAGQRADVRRASGCLRGAEPVLFRRSCGDAAAGGSGAFPAEYRNRSGRRAHTHGPQLRVRLQVSNSASVGT